MARSSPDSPRLSRRSPAGVPPDFALEAERLACGDRLVAGVDEAGRGPLAGPVVAAAVILAPADAPPGLNDSKTLTAKAREALFDALLCRAMIGLGSAGAAEIDRLNIRQATFLAMRRAVGALPLRPDHCLVDGIDVPPGLGMAATALVSGDARSLSIAAASIVAKVMRDRMMAALGTRYPAYGFERHMGYGTRAHVEAIRLHGATPHHRLSFAPLKRTKAAG